MVHVDVSIFHYDDYVITDV